MARHTLVLYIRSLATFFCYIRVSFIPIRSKASWIYFKKQEVQALGTPEAGREKRSGSQFSVSVLPNILFRVTPKTDIIG